MSKLHTSSVHHVSDIKEYKNLIENRACVIKFTAPWCGPCKKIAPIYEQLASSYSSKIEFLEVNIDNGPEITNMENVQSIPLFIFYLLGKRDPSFSVLGANSSSLKSNVIELFNSLSEDKLTPPKGILTPPTPSPSQNKLTLDEQSESDSDSFIDDRENYIQKTIPETLIKEE